MFLISCGFPIAAVRVATAGVDLESAQPNIILFLTDDMGWGDAAVFDHPYLITPNIDRIAEGGTVFKKFYSASPVCSPSRVAFMTGNFPARHSVHTAFGTEERNQANNQTNYLDPCVNLISKTLQENGYRTAHFGKWHLSSSPTRVSDIPNPTHYGFSDHATYHTYFPDVERRHILIRGNDPYYRANSTRAIVDLTLKFMRDNAGHPVYVNAWTLVPHAPLIPTPEELAVYADLDPKPEDFPEYMRDYLAEIPLEDLKRRMQIYCASMTSLDTALGVLIDGLEEMGQLENTLILFTSDNGPEDRFSKSVNSGVGSPGPLRGRKRSIYKGGVAVPCIAYWPGTVPSGRVDSTSVLSAVDWFPTLCSLTGAPMPDYHCDGEDVSDILKGAERARIKPLFWEWRFEVRGDSRYKAPQLAVLAGEWRGFINPDGSALQLYNVATDPSEKINVADQHPEMASVLKRKMMDWKASLPMNSTNSPSSGLTVTLESLPASDARIDEGTPANKTSESAPLISQEEFDYARNNLAAEETSAEAGKAAAQELSVRGGLSRFFEKARAGEKLTVAYFGGSITAAPGWRPMTFEGLQKMFPQSELTMINASIGGTGSIIGLFRADEDLLPSNPDLVFIEFAVNDGRDAARRSNDVLRAMEGIILKVRQQNPVADICLIYTMNDHHVKTIRDGWAHEAAALHEQVAQYYNLPSIYVGPAVVQAIEAGDAVFTGEVADQATGRDAEDRLVITTDKTHPTGSGGHAFYAEVVMRSLEKLAASPVASQAKLPIPMFGKSWVQAAIIPVEGNAEFSGKWEKLTATDGPSCRRFGKKIYSQFPHLYRTDEAGASVTVRFTGTMVGVKGFRGPDSGIVYVQVDDHPAIEHNYFTVYNRQTSYEGIVLPELDDGEHTVTWTLSSTLPDKGKILASYYKPDNDRDFREHPEKYEPIRFSVGQIQLIGEIQ